MKAYYSNTLNHKGNRGITFDKSKSLTGTHFELPCGCCMECRIQYSQQWTTRMLHELHYHEEASYLTFTFAPGVLQNEYDLGGSYIHIQKFIRRLRKRYPEKDIRYVVSGEYGKQAEESKGEGLRPHYHMILYGYYPGDAKFYTTNENGDPLYISEEISRLWKNGHILLGEVNETTCQYVTKYIQKKLNGDTEEVRKNYERICEYTGEVFSVEKEFMQSSKRPAIGRRFVEEYFSDIFDYDQIIIDGKKRPVPYYYTRLLENMDNNRFREIDRIRQRKSRQENINFKRAKSQRENRAFILKDKDEKYRRNG